jgi:hypothetical protein
MMHLDRRASSLLQSHVSEGPDDELLTTPQLANWFGTTTQKVEGDRRKGIGPPFVQMAGRDIRYSRGTVRKWLEQRVRQCTAEYTRRAEMKKRKS